MKKNFIVLLLLLSNCCYAQYALQSAFPNLSKFDVPTEFVSNRADKIFVAQLNGIINVFNNSTAVNTKKTFIDLSSKVSQTKDELGLLGLAFHPDYINNRFFYVHYVFDSTESISGHWVRISRFTANNTNPDTATIDTELTLITIPLTEITHNGGKIAFGPDNYLYIALGDGGTGGDLAQDKTELLGKILRINVDSVTKGRNYSIPPLNPFYENELGYREEIYAYGFRNPWKFSFDSATNTLWAGDVGQAAFEEIDLVESGKNYGWNRMEGFHCYPDSNYCDSAEMNFTPPIWAYSHAEMGGGTIIGGHVYRGSMFPELYGKYIYGDFVNGKIWSFTYDKFNTPINTELYDTDFYMTCIGMDQNNELYIVDYEGEIFKFAISKTLHLTALIEGFYYPEVSEMVSDTVTVHLRHMIPPYTIVDSARSILDFSGTGTFNFINPQNDSLYLITIKHRNSIETVSADCFAFSDNYAEYDFTSDASQAYGNNLVLKETEFCIYSGDVNQDGIIDASDLSAVDNDVFNSASGYLSTDVNGDYIVDASDISIIDNNVFKAIIIAAPY